MQLTSEVDAHLRIIRNTETDEYILMRGARQSGTLAPVFTSVTVFRNSSAFIADGPKAIVDAVCNFDTNSSDPDELFQVWPKSEQEAFTRNAKEAYALVNTRLGKHYCWTGDYERLGDRHDFEASPTGEEFVQFVVDTIGQ